MVLWWFDIQHQPDNVQEVFGQYSQEHSVAPGDGAVQGWELESVILVPSNSAYSGIL